MIRSNLLIRRIASKYVAPRAASATCPAIDALVASSTSSAAGAPSTATIYRFSTTPLTITSRKFSSSPEATELGSLIQREINEEEEASAEHDGKVPPELAELQSDISTKWTILEGISGIGSDGATGSGASVRMFRKEAGSNGAKIGIVFHCQDTEEDVRFDETNIFEDDEGEKEEEEEPSQAVRFGVTVSKGGKTVVIQCRSGWDVSVESVMVRDGDTESVLAALAEGEGMHASLYQGPEFTELAEDLQTSFQNYVVKECGVDEDVAAFITMFCDYREQEEYLSWMKTTIDILD